MQLNAILICVPAISFSQQQTRSNNANEQRIIHSITEKCVCACCVRSVALMIVSRTPNPLMKTCRSHINTNNAKSKNNILYTKSLLTPEWCRWAHGERCAMICEVCSFFVRRKECAMRPSAKQSDATILPQLNQSYLAWPRARVAGVSWTPCAECVEWNLNRKRWYAII